MLAISLVAAGPVTAEGLAPLDVRALPEAWGAPGGPGLVDDLAMGHGLPFAWMGIVAGGVTLRDGLLPAFGPWPGLDEIVAPRAWYDSAAVVIGEDAGWNGFSASLVELRALATPPRTRRPRASFTMVNGSSAVDRTGLFLQRGGEDSWLRGGALTEQRSGTGSLEARGQHVWFADLGLRRGAHALTGAFSQRGSAGGTRRDATFLEPGVRPPFVGLEDAAHGEGGSLGWNWARDASALHVTLARSHDHRESFESELFDVFAEREAQQNSLEIEASDGDDARGHGVRLELTQAKVTRSEDFLTQRPALEARHASVWLAARDVRPLLGGRLEAQLGVGHTDAPSRKAERMQLAPSMVWRLEEGGRRWRAHVGRFVTPLWCDLAPGVGAFVQDTWAAGAGLAAGSEAHQWFELSGVATETGQRALLQRWPIRDLSLRYGWTPERVRIQDALVQGSVGVRRGWFGADGSAWSRVRPVGSEVAHVDPALGGRVGAEARFAAFTGDLRVRLRFETAWVGDRETEPLEGFFTAPQPLPGYATYGASAAFTIGDAIITLRGMNLEDVAHPQVWTDPTTPFPGTPAVGSTREFRFELSWPFFN